MSCTCGPNEACSERPKTSVNIEDVRQALLRSMMRYVSVPGNAANDVRNWATAYGILSDKDLAENRVTTHMDASGTTYYVDARGRLLEWDARGTNTNTLTAVMADKPA